MDDKIAANEAKDCNVREEPRIQETCRFQFFDHWAREQVKVFSGFAAIAIIVAKIVPVRSTMVGEMGCR